jgi:excinuclease ABC subunit C
MTKDGMVYMMLFNTHKGTLLNKQEFVFDQTVDFFQEFLTQYYSDNDVPREIILPIEPDDSVSDYLVERRGGPVTITVPKIGEKKDLIDLVYKNIEIGFFGEIGKVVRLESALKLKQEPKVIECFDISHLGGTAMVGSMVQFRNGKPDKANYRRFKIKTVEQIDDFAAIAEIVSRRYGRLKQEGAEMPDLVIIDGGEGQLSAAVDALDRLSVKLPVIALAKKLEEIYFPGSKFPLHLDRKDKALLFLQEIRDEAHRFAIKYNRLLRKKKIRE